MASIISNQALTCNFYINFIRRNMYKS